MPTVNQLVRKPRVIQKARTKSPACRAFLRFLGKGEGPPDGAGRRRNP